MSFDLKLTNGDVSIKSGDVDIVERSDKMVQDILKFISTPVGTLLAFPSYGTYVTKSLIGTADTDEFISNVAEQQLRSGLRILQQLQQDQMKQNQIVTADEQIAAIKDVSVNRAADDPRYFIGYLTVISKAFQMQTIPFAISTV